MDTIIPLLFWIAGMSSVAYGYLRASKPKQAGTSATESPTIPIKDLEYELLGQKDTEDLLRRLSDELDTPEEKKQAAIQHFDLYHSGKQLKGIYSCCIDPRDPRDPKEYPHFQACCDKADYTTAISPFDGKMVKRYQSCAEHPTHVSCREVHYTRNTSKCGHSSAMSIYTISADGVSSRTYLCTDCDSLKKSRIEHEQRNRVYPKQRIAEEVACCSKSTKFVTHNGKTYHERCAEHETAKSIAINNSMTVDYDEAVADYKKRVRPPRNSCDHKNDDLIEGHDFMGYPINKFARCGHPYLAGDVALRRRDQPKPAHELETIQDRSFDGTVVRTYVHCPCGCVR